MTSTGKPLVSRPSFKTSGSAGSACVGAPGKTVARTLALLVDLLLGRRRPAWPRKVGKHFVKSPKLFVHEGASPALCSVWATRSNCSDIPWSARVGKALCSKRCLRGSLAGPSSRFLSDPGRHGNRRGPRPAGRQAVGPRNQAQLRADFGQVAEDRALLRS